MTAIDPAEHVRLAVSIARRYGRNVPDEEAVLEEAYFSLLGAARRFDPTKGTWAAFASASIVLAVRGEVARQLGAPRTVSLFVAGEDGDEVERRDLPHAEPHDGAGLMAERLREVLADMDPREAEVIRRRYGLDGPEETIEETGRAVGLGRSRVGQLERRALEKLRRALARRSR